MRPPRGAEPRPGCEGMFPALGSAPRAPASVPGAARLPALAPAELPSSGHVAACLRRGWRRGRAGRGGAAAGSAGSAGARPRPRPRRPMTPSGRPAGPRRSPQVRDRGWARGVGLGRGERPRRAAAARSRCGDAGAGAGGRGRGAARAGSTRGVGTVPPEVASSPACACSRSCFAPPDPPPVPHPLRRQLRAQRVQLRQPRGSVSVAGLRWGSESVAPKFPKCRMARGGSPT